MNKKLFVANKTFEESELSVSEIRECIKMGASAPIAKALAARALLQDRIAILKTMEDSLSKTIDALSWEDAMKKMVDEGVLPDAEDYRPAITVKTRGGTITLSITPKEDSGFTISDELKKKDIVSSIVPEKYKKLSVTINKGAMEKDFDAGTLPDVLKSYVGKAPKTVMLIRKKTDF